MLLKMQGVTETPALNFDVWCLQTVPVWSLSYRSSSGQWGESAPSLRRILSLVRMKRRWVGSVGAGDPQQDGGGNVGG